MVTFEVLTLFPRMLSGPLSESLLGKAREAGHVDVRLRDVREYAEGRHRVCDDTPYGGGAGMVMKPEPLVAAIEAARAEGPAGARTRVVLLSPAGPVLDQAGVARLADHDHLVLVCGRYEGVDERVADFVDETLSVGDFVLSGGEPAAWIVIDAVSRLIPGVLGNEASAAADSFTGGVLEHPQYTRPPEYRGRKVPEVLLSGDHARIARWRRGQALARTRAIRPDLFARLDLSAEDRRLLADLDEEMVKALAQRDEAS
jgi:tRNA (guanine37-N1)-methyltransferase